MVVAGMILVTAGLALASAARTLIEVYLAYGLSVGLGVGFSYVPALAPCSSGLREVAGLRLGLP